MTSPSYQAKKRKRRRWKKFYADPENRFQSSLSAYRLARQFLRCHLYDHYERSDYHEKRAEEVVLSEADWKGQMLLKDLLRRKVKTAELAKALGRVWP